MTLNREIRFDLKNGRPTARENFKITQRNVLPEQHHQVTVEQKARLYWKGLSEYILKILFSYLEKFLTIFMSFYNN